jgi:hypothetical protein
VSRLGWRKNTGLQEQLAPHQPDPQTTCKRRHAFAAAAGWLAASLALTGGLGWRDCVLVATGVALAMQAFRAGMVRQAPWPGWRAALRCTTAGVLSMLAALALVGWVAIFAWVGPSAHPLGLAPSLGVLGAAGALAWFGRPAALLQGRALAGFALALCLAALVEVLARRSGTPASCVFALGVAALLAVQGWRLAHGTAHGLWEADRR